MERTTWNEKLTVDAKIVRLLSAATYEDFPSAIRELVSNAYDADSTEVAITVDLRRNLIQLADNGNGMTREEFGFFLRIAGQERERHLSPNFARRRIGQFGIGFLAVFPFGREIKISSTARRSDVRFEATIPSEKYFDVKGAINVEDIPIPGVEIKDKSVRDQHGVTIAISPLTEMVHRYFKALPSTKKSAKSSPFERFKWTMQDDLPLDYHEGSVYKSAFADLGSLDFKVILNGEELFRNGPGTDVLENKEWSLNGIRCRYVITTNWKSLPNEERGLKVRLNNVGIGAREFFGLGTEGRTFSRLHWLTGEIRILEGFDQLLNIDRAKFRESPEYDQFRDHFASRLRHHAYHVETVSEAKRDIERQLNDSRIAEVGPRKDLIEKNVTRLKEKGFEVKRSNATREGSQSVRVDLSKKVVEVTESSTPFSDYVTVGFEKVPVEYSTWNPLEDPRAVRRSKHGVLEINQVYPLFRSKRYGEIFRRIFVILLITDEESGERKELQSTIAQKFINEFIDLL